MFGSEWELAAVCVSGLSSGRVRTCVNSWCNVLLCNCNRVYLHIVFVLLYSVCRSVSVLSCVDVIQSFTYGLRVIILDVTKRRGVRESAKESKRRYQQPLADTIKKEKNIPGTCGCGSFVVAYFQTATSSTVYIIHFMADLVISAVA